ncbi:hypothetical protein [Flavisolibacter nicotianae]|uniref:hypothetical protein n=1 Tax=Flavisolibacter nicotianae TaxID=2364882 RepID=UPI0013C4D830|nr:hypothetical protein [Flavisolibacter nicotianae]
MNKILLLVFSICCCIISCKSGKEKSGKIIRSSVVDKSNSATNREKLSFDTTKIAIIPYDTTYYWVLKNTLPIELKQDDLQIIDSLLSDCIQAHNIKQDATKEFSEYIDLRKYKLQYLPFADKKGRRMVYVNGFCDFEGFDYWKRSLVTVNDGGICFFQVSINLSMVKYERLYTNGYAQKNIPSESFQNGG